MRTSAWLLVLTLPSLGAAQVPKNLAEYLTRHPWDVSANGPLLVLEPERVRPNSPATSLGAFPRKKMVLGGLNTLVPRTMIVIDDSLRQEPNLYEGMPNDAKMIYLLRSLNDAQWRKVTSDGIGVSDLQGEQRLVFESILPKRFGWVATRVGRDGMWTNDQKKGVLTDEERKKVRIKVDRKIEFTVHLQKENATSSFGTDRYRGEPGTIFYERDKNDEYVQKSAFGLDIRKEVDNVLKPSQLSYTAEVLQQKVAIQTSATVGEILKKIGVTCGLEIIPDYRVADRRVTFLGGSAPARDLLQALALSVEGTYRRVGPAFVLTSDLVGMGSRKLKLAYWQDQLQDSTYKRTDEWRKEIGAQKGYNKIVFDPDSPVSPTGPLVEKFDDGSKGYQREDVDTSLLTPELRRYLDQWDKEYRLQPIRKDKVGLNARFHYQYVLPNGRQLSSEGSLGEPWQFKEQPTIPRQSFSPGTLPTFPIAVPADRKLAFLAASETTAGAQELVAALSRVPQSRLWLDTHNAAALRAAVRAGAASGVEVGLALRPWRVATDDPDRTIAGESGRQVQNRLSSSPRMGPIKYNTIGDFGTLMPPTSPQVAATWAEYKALADTAGIVGITLLETQPYGYEPKRERWYSSFGPLQWAIISHGYTVNQRLQFLRQEGVDPIDIGDGGYWTTPDLRQTYFFDDGLRGMPSVYDGSDDTHPKADQMGKLWLAFVSKQNRSAIDRLLAMLSGHPISIERRPENINMLPLPYRVANPWTPGLELPMALDHGTSVSDGTTPGYIFYELPEYPGAPESTTSLYIINNQVTGPASGRPVTVIYDLERIPVTKVSYTISRWFKPKE